MQTRSIPGRCGCMFCFQCGTSQPARGMPSQALTLSVDEGIEARAGGVARCRCVGNQVRSFLCVRSGTISCADTERWRSSTTSSRRATFCRTIVEKVGSGPRQTRT
eukprot:1828160-Rhodomonas_salina.2